MCVRREEGGEGGGRALPWKGNDLLMERSGLYILAIISRRKVVTRFSRIVADRSRSVYRAMHVNKKKCCIILNLVDVVIMPIYIPIISG